MHRNLTVLLIALACIFSGLTVEANTGKGFLLLMLPAVLLVSLAHLMTRRTYNLRWLVSVAGFLTVSLLNGSRPGSIVLVLNCMIAYEGLILVRSRLSVTRTDQTFVLLIAFSMLFLAVLDIALTGGTAMIWSSGRDGFHGMPRLRLFFSEPSYLGTFLVALLFSLRNRKIQLALLPIALLSQSSIAAIYVVVLTMRRRPVLLGLFGAIAAGALFGWVLTSDLAYFTNSGFVRLAGATLLPQMTTEQWVIGAGWGTGDLALQPLYDLINQTGATGFIFSLVHDMGILGVLCIYGAYARSRFDVVHLTFLLLNLSGGSFLLPVLLSMFTPARQNQTPQIDQAAIVSAPT